MISLGFCLLGAFVGYVITYTLQHVSDWTAPLPILSGVLSAAVAGGILAFIKFLLPDKNVTSTVALYPIGLAYGALCTNLTWITGPNANGLYAILHIVAFAVATVLLLALMLSPAFRKLLPN